jgi:superfamily II DNA or RNA helicase
MDVPDAKGVIEKFGRSSQRWLVAVRMVSEGVDIPRLAVGVYATRARTPLLFRQVVGRFVRTRTDTDPNALLFIVGSIWGIRWGLRFGALLIVLGVFAWSVFGNFD